MLKTFQLNNKLLCLDYNDEYLLIGDSRGQIHQFKDNRLSVLYHFDGPISNIKIYKDDIFCTTWDGELYKNQERLFLMQDIIKALIIINDLIYVSIAHKIYIITLDLEIIEQVDVPHKVLCFGNLNNKPIYGFNLPMIGIGENNITMDLKHDTAILSMKIINNTILTGSVDGKILGNIIYDDTGVKSEIIYESKKWIRSIFDKELFSSGNDVIVLKDQYKVLYSHGDEVMGVARINGKIFSIGLDGKLLIYEEEILFDDELKEIEELNRMFS